MLSVTPAKVPRIVAIRVAKAEKLVPSMKNNKKKLNGKFRVVILGGKKKESSELVEDSSGNPEWGFSCLLKRHQGSLDPISLLVEDSEGHHKGQVVIPLVKINPKPYTFSPEQNPATSSNLVCSELEPTNKCSSPSGFLIYWIWVEEYCQENDTTSRSSFNKSMTSLFGSKHTLGSSKSRLSHQVGSTTNIGSGVTLNKPESHKKTLSFLHIKSKKDKSKKSVPDSNKSPDSSDVDSYMEPGNPFDIDSSYSAEHRMRGSDLQVGSHHNPFEGSNTATANIAQKHEYFPSISSNGSIFESGSISKHGDVTEFHPNFDQFTPITLSSSVDNDHKIKTTSSSPTKHESADVPTTLLGKSMMANRQSPTMSRLDSDSTNDAQPRPAFQIGHKSNSGSINSLFADQMMNQSHVPSIKAAAYDSSILNMNPVTLPPVDADTFKKPLPKSNEPVKIVQRSPSDKVHQLTTNTPGFVPPQPVERNRPSAKIPVVNDYSFTNDQNTDLHQLSTSVKFSEFESSLNSMTPIKLPPVDTEIARSKSPAKIKDSKQAPAQSPVFGKSTEPNNQNPPPNKDPFQQGITGGFSKNQTDLRVQPIVNDEAEILRKENSELKTQNSKSLHKISDLQNELDHVKDCLFKLRNKLLEEGATEYLEKL